MMLSCLAKSVWALTLIGLTMSSGVALAVPGPELADSPEPILLPSEKRADQVAAGQAADGRVVIAFTIAEQLYLQRFERDGSPSGELATLLPGNNQLLYNLSLSVGANGHYAIAAQAGLQQSAKIFVLRYNADGTRLRSEGEPDDGAIPGQVRGGAPVCAQSDFRATHSPAVAVDGQGNLAYSYSQATYCTTGPGNSLQPHRTELFYRYAPAGGVVSDARLAFNQSPVDSRGFRILDQVSSAVALHENGHVLLSWNGHAQANELPQTYIRPARLADFTAASTLVPAQNSFDRAAPQLGLRAEGYVLSWRGQYNDPETLQVVDRCYAQVRALDGSARFQVKTLVGCDSTRSLIITDDVTFDVVNQSSSQWTGRRYDGDGAEVGSYSGGLRPSRFLDQLPLAWAPTLAAGDYLAVYEVYTTSGDRALQAQRYGGPRGSLALNLELTPAETLTIDDGRLITLFWNSNAAAGSCFGFGELAGGLPSTGNRLLGRFTTAGERLYGIACGPETPKESVTLRIIDDSPPTVEASWSPTTIVLGEPATLSYRASNAEHCEYTLSGEFTESGSAKLQDTRRFTFSTAGEQTFQYVCTGPGGEATAVAKLSVTAPKPIVRAQWSAEQVGIGELVTLSYVSEHADRCQYNLTGEYASQGSAELQAVNPFTFSRPGEQRFTLTCSGPGGEASATAALRVTAPAPTVQLQWSQSQAMVGEEVLVSYQASDAEYCITSLSGEFNLSSRGDPQGVAAFTFTRPGTQIATVTCHGIGGSVSAEASLTVVAPVPTVNASWSKYTVLVGEPVLFSHQSTHADRCQYTATGEFAGSGGLEKQGSQSFTFSRVGSQVITVVCTGPGGAATASAALAVTAMEPTVQAQWTPSRILAGESSQIEFSSEYADTCEYTLTGEHANNGPLDASAGSGRFVFRLPGTVAFTYTCNGAGGSATTVAQLIVEPGIEPPTDPVTRDARITLTDGRFADLRSSAGRLQNPRTVSKPTGLPSGFAFPTDFIAFEIAEISPGSTVTMTMTLPAGVVPTAYIKCAESCAVFSGAQIVGNVVRLTLTDGGAGDADGVANGVIVDPGAPAIADTGPAKPERSGGGSIDGLLLMGLVAPYWLRRLKRRLH